MDSLRLTTLDGRSDWPGTYGYNLFAYPLATWLGGPFDIFVEHGHRLLGALVGLLTIALVAVTFRFENRITVRWLSIGCLLGVIGQGLLGGLRVRMNDVAFAKSHGITGPIFFCLIMTMIVTTSNWWSQSEKVERRDVQKLALFSCILTLLTFTQLVLGAHLRHLPADMLPTTFSAFALGHILVAMLILVHVVLLAKHCFRSSFLRSTKWIRNGAILITSLLLAQVALGVSTWLVKYGWPIWLPSVGLFQGYIVVEKGMIQALVITGHVAIGSLLLATSWFVSLRSLRITAYHLAHQPTPSSDLTRLEVVA